METPVIADQTRLRHHIMQLNALKEEQELILKHEVKELYYSLQPSALIRKTIRSLKEDQELKAGALNGALNLGAGFLVDKIMPGSTRRGGIKRYLVSEGIKKLLSLFIARKTAETA